MGCLLYTAGQRGALVDAEAVLLVGDDETKILILYIGREQGEMCIRDRLLSSLKALALTARDRVMTRASTIASNF